MSSGARTGGFSLVEMAIVLVVLGVLAQASLVPIAALDASRRERRVDRDIAVIKDALVARLISAGELPCPLPDTQGRPCRLRGGVPARSLALDLATDSEGAALDPWGRPYLYALSETDSRERGEQGVADWTAADDILEVGLDGLRGSLSVCREARAPCPDSDTLAEDLVLVVLSHGADASGTGLQSLNAADDGAVFTRAPTSAVSEYRYDDTLAWLSRSEALWWLLRAHRLP